MPVPEKFSKFIAIYETDSTGQPLTKPDGSKVVKKEIGLFIFRKPTVRDEMDIGVQRSINLKGRPVAEVDSATFLLADAFARLPILTVQAPPDWKLEEIADGEVIMAVLNALAEGETGEGAQPVAEPESERKVVAHGRRG